MPSLLTPRETRRMYALMAAEKIRALTAAERTELANLQRDFTYTPTYLGD